MVVEDWVVDLERAYRHVLEEASTTQADRRAAGLLPPRLKAVLEGGPESLTAITDVVRVARTALSGRHIQGLGHRPRRAFDVEW